MGTIKDLDTEHERGLLIRKVVSDLCSSIKKCNYTNPNVYFCFDGYSWRKSIYAPYKVGRGDKPEGFYFCQEFIRKQLLDKGYKAIKSEDGESDDCIALLCEILPGRKMIYSSDEDMHQLVNPEVSVWNNNKLYSKLFINKEDERVYLNCEYKKVVINPREVLFKKVLLGCSMDNVSPLIDKKGIGEKTILKSMHKNFGADYEISDNLNPEEIERFVRTSVKDFKYERKDFSKKLKENVKLVKLSKFCFPDEVLDQFFDSFNEVENFNFSEVKSYEVGEILRGSPYWKDLG